MVRLIIFLGLSFTAFGLASDTPLFVDETATSGVDHVYDGGWEFFVGGGVAAFDCDGNNLPDLFFAGGVNESALYRNVGETGGSLKFEKVEGLEPLFVTGAYPLDIDGDGILDLAVLRVGENILYRGLGDCRFERANELWELWRRTRLDDGVCSHLGSWAKLADPRFRQLRRPRRPERAVRHLRPEPAVPADGGGGL